MIFYYRLGASKCIAQRTLTDLSIYPMDTSRTTLFLIAALPYGSANQVLSEIRHRFPTLRLAAPEMPDLSQSEVLAVEVPAAVEPGMLIESWRDQDFLSHWLQRPARLGGVITLLDTARFEVDLRSQDRLVDRGWASAPHDGRTVADLLVEQIEASSTIALLGSDALSETTRRWVRILNPTARLELCAASDGGLLGRLLAVEERAFEPTTPSWLRALRSEPPWPNGFRGGSCIVYRRHAPFESDRIARWLGTPHPGVLRGKGQLWLSDRWDERIGYSCAGSVQRTFPAGTWWASTVPGRWPTCPRHGEDLLSTWHPRFGDRQQRIVLLGDTIVARELTASLDSCLSDVSTMREGRARATVH
jgi:G3E family GTPase